MKKNSNNKPIENSTSAKQSHQITLSRRFVPASAAALSVIVLGAAVLNGCGSSSSASSATSSSSASYAGAAAESYVSDFMDNSYDTGYSSLDSGYYYNEESAAESESANDYSDVVLDGIADYVQKEQEAETRVDIPENAQEDDTSENQMDQKLIITWYLSMETEHYEEAVNQVRTSVSQAGGYIESEYEYSYDENSHYESLTIRIPREKTDSWLEGVSAYGTITERSKSSEDITLTYVDTQSRLEALRTEQQTLLKMMEKTDNITDLIAIQTELTNVNADIESYESQLRVMDNQVSYTTVYLNISEVNREIPVVMSFWEEVRETFLNSMDGLGYYAREIAVGILGNSVIIIMMAAVIACVVLIMKKIIKHIRKAAAKKNKNAKTGTASAEKQNGEEKRNGVE